MEWRGPGLSQLNPPNRIQDRPISPTVFFVTGREEPERDATEKNLSTAGYSGWKHLYMQPETRKGEKKAWASVAKPINRQAIEDQHYHIILNIGDQASDLAGCCAERVFKLPNRFYLVQ